MGQAFDRDGHVLGEAYGDTKREVLDQLEKRHPLAAEIRIQSLREKFVAGRELPDLDVVSAKVHEAWMATKRAQGVTSRLAEDGEELMVPYAQLSEHAKDLDRGTVRAVYAAIRATETAF